MKPITPNGQRPVAAPALELHLRPKLYLPRRRRRRSHQPRGRRDARTCGRVHNRIRRQEISVVRHVEELRSELQPKPIVNRETLTEREIDIPKVGSVN